MKVRVLGCSGAITRDCRTTSFLLDSKILVDAGTGVGDLSLEEMCGIDHLLLTHSHLDHICALPLMLDSVAGKRKTPLKVHALASTIAALRNHVFNNVIWPDFSQLPSPEAPFVVFEEFTTGLTLKLDNKLIEVLPAVHTVPAVGFAVSEGSGWWVYTGDTERNPLLWKRVNELDVAMLFIETAFSNREANLARRSLHLSPEVLARELECIGKGRRFPIYITHTKPAETELIMAEIRELDRAGPPFGHEAHDIRWLSAGQEFEI